MGIYKLSFDVLLLIMSYIRCVFFCQHGLIIISPLFRNCVPNRYPCDDRQYCSSPLVIPSEPISLAQLTPCLNLSCPALQGLISDGRLDA